MKKYKIGDIIKVVVSGIEDYGIFVKIDKKYDGLIHISEISHDFVRKINDYASIGEEIYAEVIEIIEEEKRMKLSIKNIDYKNTGERRSKIDNEKEFEPLKEALAKWQSEYQFDEQ